MARPPKPLPQLSKETQGQIAFAQYCIHQQQYWAKEVQRVRRSVLLQLHTEGYTYRKMGELFGMSYQRVHQIIHQENEGQEDG